MNILAIDTAANLCAACVYDRAAGEVKSRVVLDIGKGHAEHVMDVVERALQESGLSYPQIKAVAVNSGPGSFTGVRVGISAARGIGLAHDRQTCGVNALDALAFEAREKYPGRSILVATGNRDESLACLGVDGTSEFPFVNYELLSADEAREKLERDTILVGDGGCRIARALGRDCDFDSATADITSFARLAAKAQGTIPAVPLYLRDPDAKPQSEFALAIRGI
ncbi:tRNA (adenosine(37)-N6)-threonylcarbamoyltransferase complex dimerization subunit type 1 TsaB [Nitratireductor basaltis]|uniref:Peptidase M22, glycoprotease n=1 Tax=Nitratireductor basaltis TaxID=472175 RepID=A0A084UEA5_9HYPH|nr:tRNA (adenosine(37)-N6)-threonylcarbamoyltransferase complex dimerization subunit type 1 TsaB [Nitratireductor basaltis]KFB11291.1 Peptidase M22, glycoprotease [Nitratireductor basaltis]